MRSRNVVEDFMSYMQLKLAEETVCDYLEIKQENFIYNIYDEFEKKLKGFEKYEKEELLLDITGSPRRSTLANKKDIFEDKKGKSYIFKTKFLLFDKAEV